MPNDIHPIVIVYFGQGSDQFDLKFRALNPVDKLYIEKNRLTVEQTNFRYFVHQKLQLIFDLCKFRGVFEWRFRVKHQNTGLVVFGIDSKQAVSHLRIDLKSGRCHLSFTPGNVEENHRLNTMLVTKTIKVGVTLAVSDELAIVKYQVNGFKFLNAVEIKHKEFPQALLRSFVNMGFFCRPLVIDIL